jgi:hypothetical protein
LYSAILEVAEVRDGFQQQALNISESSLDVENSRSALFGKIDDLRAQIGVLQKVNKELQNELGKKS